MTTPPSEPLDPTVMKRPSLPRAWYRPTVAGFLGYLLHASSWLVVFGFASMSILGSELPTAAKMVLLVPSVILTGHGFHMLGWFAHEGVHLSLLPNKYVSTAVGCVVGALALFPTYGYGVTHWTHHRFTNQQSDPDTRIYSRYRTFWARFFMGRVAANRGYIRNTVLAALGRPLPKSYHMPFRPRWARFFAVFTLACAGVALVAYVAVAVVAPTYFLVGLLLPYLTAIPTSGLRIYLEHNGTGAGIFRDTRSYVSTFWTVLMFGNNFHLEHHLYPTVPAYHLPRVHHLLQSQGLYARYGAHLANGVLAPLRYLGARYQYPEALIDDLDADPFVSL
ncbi:MAG: fatty acid desaturase [Myxococcales bacterium]|nr:fatty acid desaturase [Myxococcales bacterium]